MPQPLPGPSTPGEQILVNALATQLRMRRLEAHIVRNVVDLLSLVEKDLQARLETALRKRRIDAPSAVRLARIRRELQSAFDEATRALSEGITAESSGLASAAVGWAANDVESALPFALSLRRPDPTLLAAASLAEVRKGTQLWDSMNAMSASMTGRVMDAVRVGVVVGDSPKVIAARIFDEAGPFLKTRHHAETLAISLAHTIHADAREALWEENKDIVKYVMAVVTLDDRTCRICGPRDGKVWTLEGKKPVGHSVAWGAGPGRWHLRCRCTTIPVLGTPEDFENAGFDLSKLSSGERASMGGPVPVSTDYEQWLGGQPQDVRERALGVKRARLWEENPDLPLAEVVKQTVTEPLPVSHPLDKVKKRLPRLNGSADPQLPPTGGLEGMFRAGENGAAWDALGASLYDYKWEVARDDSEAFRTGTARVGAIMSEMFPGMPEAEKAAQKMVKSWNLTSADGNWESVASQLIAREMFDLDESITGHLKDSTVARARELMSRSATGLLVDAQTDLTVREYIETFIAAQHQASLENFKAAGVTHVTLFRGARYPHKVDGVTRLELQPLNSWTADPEMARRFAGGIVGSGAEGAVHMARVPVEQILGSPWFGSGVLSEFEFVVMGRDLWTYTWHEFDFTDSVMGRWGELPWR